MTIYWMTSYWMTSYGMTLRPAVPARDQFPFALLGGLRGSPACPSEAADFGVQWRNQDGTAVDGTQCVRSLAAITNALTTDE